MAVAQILLSYARPDRDRVEDLYHKLSDAGFKPWMDTKDILPGEVWKYSAQTAIRRSDFFLACLSANSITKRGHLQKEIKDALDIWQEMLEDDIYLIPVRLEDCEVPESLHKFQWVNLFEKDGWTRLVKALQVGMERRRAVTKPVVQEPLSLETHPAQGKPSPSIEIMTPEAVPGQVSSLNHAYALVIGISTYRYLCPLSKATTDAHDLYDLLTQSGYPTTNLAILLDERATKAAISDRLDWLTRRTGPRDTLLIFFSGHGAQRIGGFEAGEYLCPVEADWYNLHSTAISDKELTAALQAIGAGRVVVFLDACHAGGVGEPKDADLQVKAGLSEAVYAQLAEGHGRVIVASCQPNEVSWELTEMRNGLFTYHLLAGLRGAAAGTDGAVRILDLFNYISQYVPEHKPQHPLFKGEIDLNFAIVVLPLHSLISPREISTREEEIMEPDLEFANREAELQLLKKPLDNPGAPRYVQVYAPCGLGKTYLLKKTRDEYEKAGWLCAWLDFSSDEMLRHQTALILKQLGDQFGARAKKMRTCADLAQQVMRAKKQSVIFLDSVNLASGEVRRWIKNHLIPNLEERILDPNFRPYFITASRHSIREWAAYSKQKFESLSLTPFTDNVVYGRLRQLAQAAGYMLPDSFFQQTTEAILLITKGLPAGIQAVLEEIQTSNFTMPPQEVTQASTFNRTVGALLDEEILVLHERFREIFKTLSVLRGYTPNLLDRLARDEWVPAREHINWDLEGELFKTQLVEMPDSSPLYRLEPLIRQLVALQMEYNDKERFLKLNQVAVEIFEEQVKGKDKDGNELPSPPSDRMQVILAVEALYHHLILLGQDKADKERTRSKLLGKVREYLSYRRTHENDRYWASLLLGAVEKDTELTALIYELTSEGGLEFVLQPLYALSGAQED